MLPVQKEVFDRQRTARSVAALSLLAIAAVLSASCSNSTNELLADDIDRPVIISGGSLGLDFNHTDYDECAGATAPMKRFCSAGNKITAITIWDDDGDDQSSAVCQSACPGGNCTITIQYKKDSDSAVTVKSDAARKEVYLEFDPDKLKKRPSSTRKRFSKNAKIRSILIVDGAGKETCKLGKDKYTIEISGLRR